MNVTVTTLLKTGRFRQNEVRRRSTMTPEPIAIRDQLERILSSEVFAASGRHSRLLRYLVDRTLAGEGEQLKEYVLGTEVFDRPVTYDPRIDSIVRVEARRLRTRLAEYYHGAGVADAVVITIPRGSYVPVFESRSAMSPAAPIATDPTKRTYSPAVIVAAAVSVALVVLAAGMAFNNSRDRAQAAAGPSVAVLPFEHYSGNEEEALLVARLTDSVSAELAKVGSVSVVSRTSAARYAGAHESVLEIAKALDADFIMEASAVVTGDIIHVVARLVDGRRDRKVWVGEYDVKRGDVSTSAHQIAVAAASEITRRSGS